MARYPKNSTPKLTKELIAELEDILASGVYVETAAAKVGISKDTFYRWLRDAKKPKSSKLLRKLSDAVSYASAMADYNDLSVIDLHAHGASAVYEHEVVKDKDGTVCRDKDGLPIMQIARDRTGNPIVRFAEIKSDWKAAAWKLERRSPNRWRRRSAVPQNGNDVIDEVMPDDLVVPSVEIDISDIQKYISELKSFDF